MRLNQLLPKVNSNIKITGIAYRHTSVKPGYMFVTWCGRSVNGHHYIHEALKRGASFVICEKTLSPNIPHLKVHDARRMLAEVSRRFYGYPDRKLNIVGITGTNGKTTTVLLLHHILKKAGIKSAFWTTITYGDDDKQHEAQLTTPESLDLFAFMADELSKGVKYVVMEVSSHSLVLHRVHGVEFRATGFTYLGRDHLDFHSTVENYMRAKARLFMNLPRTAIAALNFDDPIGRFFSEITDARIISYGYGLHRLPMIRGIIRRIDLHGMECEINGHCFNTTLVGTHNLYNMLLAYSIAYALSIPVPRIIEAFTDFPGVPGRWERIQNVIIDYAHTPGSMALVLSLARRLATGNLIVVFGAGGDRDPGKRRPMGEIAARYADFVIITNDNPRNEDPMQIAHEIETGVSNTPHLIILDRRKAIDKAIDMAGEGDLVLVLGKGHERYQIIGDRRIPFSDKEVVLECLSRRHNVVPPSISAT